MCNWCDTRLIRTASEWWVLTLKELLPRRSWEFVLYHSGAVLRREFGLAHQPWRLNCPFCSILQMASLAFFVVQVDSFFVISCNFGHQMKYTVAQKEKLLGCPKRKMAKIKISKGLLFELQEPMKRLFQHEKWMGCLTLYASDTLQKFGNSWEKYNVQSLPRFLYLFQNLSTYLQACFFFFFFYKKLDWLNHNALCMGFKITGYPRLTFKSPPKIVLLDCLFLNTTGQWTPRLLLTGREEVQELRRILCGYSWRLLQSVCHYFLPFVLWSCPSSQIN